MEEGITSDPFLLQLKAVLVKLIMSIGCIRACKEFANHIWPVNQPCTNIAK
jgi:hypothetical protein